MVLNSTILYSRGTHPQHILLADESKEDALFIKDTFQAGRNACGHSAELHYVETGEACLAFLRQQGEYQTAPTPHLVMLKLDRAAMTSLDVLKEMMSAPQLRCLPVIVLSETTDPDFVNQLHQLRCSCLVQRTTDQKEFQRRVHVICDYWLSVATLPTEPWRVPTTA